MPAVLLIRGDIMLGKQKCKILKEIRQRIADENDIPYITKECTFHGDCSGTCPRCESELRYLEKQLALRNSMKKRVTVAALCAGMALAVSGCSSAGTSPNATSADVEETTLEETTLEGEVPYDYTDEGNDSVDSSTCTTQGGSEQTTEQKVKQDPDSDKGDNQVDISTEELMGDVPYIEEPQAE